MLKLILADNQAIFRAGIAKVLAVEDEMRIVAQAQTTEQMIMALDKFRAAVLIIAGGFHSDFNAVLSAANKSKTRVVILADTGSDVRRQMALVDELVARRVDGLVLAMVSRDDPVLEHCLAEDVPVVLVNRTDDSDRVSSVVSDDMAGMRLAVQHLADLGHQRIGHIAGPATLSTGYLRRVGFEMAMARHKLTIPPGAIVEAQAYERDEGEHVSSRRAAHAAILRGRGARIAGRDRQDDGDRRAGSDLARDRDRSSVRARDALGDRQAETGSALAGREEDVEDPGAHLVGHPDCGEERYLGPTSECCVRRRRSTTFGRGRRTTSGRGRAGRAAATSFDRTRRLLPRL